MNINKLAIIYNRIRMHTVIFSIIALLTGLIISSYLVPLINAQESLYNDQSEFNNSDQYVEPDYFNPQTDNIDQTIEDNNQQVMSDSNCELLHDSNNLRMIDIMLSNTGVLNPSCMNELNNSLIHYTVKGIIQDRYVLLETR